MNERDPENKGKTTRIVCPRGNGFITSQIQVTADNIIEEKLDLRRHALGLINLCQIAENSSCPDNCPLMQLRKS